MPHTHTRIFTKPYFDSPFNWLSFVSHSTPPTLHDTVTFYQRSFAAITNRVMRQPYKRMPPYFHLCFTMSLFRALLLQPLLATLSRICFITVQMQIQLNLFSHSNIPKVFHVHSATIYYLVLYVKRRKKGSSSSSTPQSEAHTNCEPFFDNSCKRNAISYVFISLFGVHFVPIRFGIMQMDWGLENRMWCFC